MSTGLREQLASIHRQRGKLTPKVVLDEARDPAHPLHSRFEWDDSVAAERYRLEQAHELIRSVRVSYVGNQGPRTIRAYQAVRLPSGYVYEATADIAEDPVKREIVLREMEREWRALKARYEQFAEFSQMVRGDMSVAA